jgi:ribA/ribD-fused uncharacterized protein
MSNSNERTIHFFDPLAAYGWLASFSPHPITILGQPYKTVAHFYLSQKFRGTPLERLIIKAPSPAEAKKIARNYCISVRRDWQAIREDIMYHGIRAKFKDHADLRALLINTLDSKLVEGPIDDLFWGCGVDGKGQNRMGALLMRIRFELCYPLE